MVDSLCPVSLANGWIKGGVKTLDRRGVKRGFQRTVKEREKEGEVAVCISRTLPVMGVFTSGRSDFEGC